MNIFKKISLIGKIEKAVKRAKTLINEHEDTAKDVFKILENIKANLDSLVALLPSLKNIYNDIKELTEV